MNNATNGAIVHKETGTGSKPMPWSMGEGKTKAHPGLK